MNRIKKISLHLYVSLRNLVIVCMQWFIFTRDEFLQISTEHIGMWHGLITDGIPPHCSVSGNRNLPRAGQHSWDCLRRYHKAMLPNVCSPKQNKGWNLLRSYTHSCFYWLDIAQINWQLHASLSITFVLLLASSSLAPLSLILSGGWGVTS